MAQLKLNTAQWLQLGKKLGYIKKAQEEGDDLQGRYGTDMHALDTDAGGGAPSYNQDRHDEGTRGFIDDLLESRDKRRKSTDPDNLRSMVNKIAKENWDSETGTISSDTDLYDEINKASKEGGLSLNGQEITSIQSYMENELIQTTLPEIENNEHR